MILFVQANNWQICLYVSSIKILSAKLFLLFSHDLEKMRLTRSKLERWCHLPHFDEVVLGAFVRITIGVNEAGESVYRVCEIVGVIEGPKIYKLGKTRTNKVLKLRHAQQVRYFFGIILLQIFVYQNFKLYSLLFIYWIGNQK